MVSKNEKVINAIKNSSKQNARVEFEAALMAVIVSIMKDNMELFKEYNSNELFRKWLIDSVFDTVYREQIEDVNMSDKVAETNKDYKP